MSLRIPLPKVTKGPNCMAHPFPFQIGFQTLEFIQASIFFTSVIDYISAKYFEQNKSLEEIKYTMLGNGLSESDWEKSFNCLTNYKEVFKSWVFQNVLIQIKSHWDWYIRKLGEFILFANQHVSSPPLSSKNKNALEKIGFRKLEDQLKILEKASGVKFNISKDVLDVLKEMALVRNLGLHNRWEVDSFYIDRTNTLDWSIGEIREFDSIELGKWHECIMEVIYKTSAEISKKFIQVPDYPE
jgi:hypothetical protein